MALAEPASHPFQNKAKQLSDIPCIVNATMVSTFHRKTDPIHGTIDSKFFANSEAHGE